MQASGGIRFAFNSRPHKEVDDAAGIKRADLNLSIHDLTRRSTCTDQLH